MAQRIPNQEIFAVGRWNGDEYSVGDLDAMVSAFHSLKLPVPLKLGHSEGSKWFGQEDGHPALGWVEHVRRVGEKLVADFANVPDILVEMIKNRNYRTKSAEIYWNFISPDGQQWPRSLKAVSLLGADLPAVTTLNELNTTLMSDNTYSIPELTETSTFETSTFADGTYTVSPTLNWKEYLWSTDTEEDMDKETEKKYKEAIETAEDALKTLERKFTTLEGKNSELEKRAEDAEARAVKAEATLAESGEKNAVTNFIATVDGLIKEGKVLPKEKDGLVRQFVALGSGKKMYQEKEFSPREELVSSLQAREKVVDFTSRASGGGDTDEEPPSVRVINKANKYMRDHNIDYTKAIAKVREDDPELWDSYMNPGKGGDS